MESPVTADGGAHPVPEPVPPLPRGPGSRLASLGPIAAVLALYGRHRRFAPAVFFLAGTAWDAATIYRIDSPIDNGLVIGYLVLLGVLLPIAALVEAGHIAGPRWERVRPWFVPVKQFLLGALFSTFVFFYVQSASWSGTAVFLLALVGLLVANEFLHERVASVHLDLALYFVASATFFVYFVPMVTKVMGLATFVAGTGLAAGLVWLLAEFLRRRGVYRSTRQVYTSRAVIVGLFALYQAAYFGNWIPPVPLALRESGIYHEVVRENGGYRLRREAAPWYRFWQDDDATFRRRDGEAVYCFTSVFAPTRLQSRIYHVWQQKTEAGWEDRDRIGYEIVGGRDHGYRGYTYKRTVAPGRWRVRVETADRRVLSYVAFEVTDTEEPAEWTWEDAR